MLTDEEYYEALEKLAGDRYIQAVIVDPSAASFMALLRQRGFAVLGADNQVLSGIRRVGQLLQEGNLLFHAGCRQTAAEFLSYVWDEDDSQGQDRPVKENDHCMDAVRYFVSTVLRRNQARVSKRPRGT